MPGDGDLGICVALLIARQAGALRKLALDMGIIAANTSFIAAKCAGSSKISGSTDNSRHGS
jgi:hypothetical protein